MADPRNTIKFEGNGAEHQTFAIDGVTITYDGTKAGGSTAVDKAVTLSTGGTVALAADGDRVIGKLIEVESDSRCNVQVDGYTTLPGGASATLTHGVAIVGALGAASAKGFIRAAASATAAELIKCGGKIIDNSTTTAVVVDLG